MKTIAKITSVAAVALMMTLTNGCKKEELPAASSGTEQNAQRIAPADLSPENINPSVGIRMIGLDPGRYGSLEMEVVNVAFHYQSKDPEQAGLWVNVPVKHYRPINILNYKWSAPAAITDVFLQAGTINEIKLTFASKASLAWGDADGRHGAPAVFNPASVTIPVHGNIVKGHKLMMFFGFDVAQSVNFESEDHPYIISPIIRSLLIGNNDERIVADTK